MRSLLFVPADSERKLAKGLESGADALILDLEDSVAAGAKDAARATAREFLASQRSGPAIYVRINDLASGLADSDLEAVLAGAPTGIMLPKSNSVSDVGSLSTRLRVLEAEHGLEDGATRIIPIITETALGVFNAGSYYTMPARLAGLTWGAEDLSSEIGATTTRDATGAYTDLFRHARVATLLAASAARTVAIDTVYPDFRNEDGFRKDCLEGERDGFTARMAIHPAQVPIINEIFTPTPDAVAQARTVVDAFEAAGNPGVVAIEGKMYDRPHLRLAQRLLARAPAAVQT